MAPKKSAQNKSQTITMRIDDKTRFQLDFCSRITGMSITTFVERAIIEKANEVIIEEITQTEESSKQLELNWTDFWDPDEGFRTIQLLTSSGMRKYTTYEEDQLVLFIRTYWDYFSTDKNLDHLSREHVNTLWPHLPDLIEEWAEEKFTKTVSRIVGKLDVILNMSDLNHPGSKWG